ncbi:MAG: hypothetical protein K2R93_12500 [Gemmatimonadaceae bacterium]|nr:hypothetical protein [Gemmatimonadaceae bacterium]
MAEQDLVAQLQRLKHPSREELDALLKQLHGIASELMDYGLPLDEPDEPEAPAEALRAAVLAWLNR